MSHKTHLYEQHVALKAKMAPFAGYEMPIVYTSVKEEVEAVRKSAGVFDVSHMGEFFVEGLEAEAFVDHLICNDFKGAGAKKAVYSPLCRENGTVIDDLIAYKIDTHKVLICVNASNMEKDWNWITSQKGDYKVTLSNKSADYSLLALQGPRAASILTELNILKDNKNTPYYSVTESSFNNRPIILARTGYTGEDGFELFADHELIQKLFQEFLNMNVLPCGLAARDVLRLEVCYPLYGHELHDEITPLDSALKWTVKLEKGPFIGRSALVEYKPQFQLLKLSIEKGVPRDGYEVQNSKGETIGKVTSGTMSTTINKGIAFVHVKKDLYQAGEQLYINIRGKNYEATLHTKSFVTGGHI